MNIYISIICHSSKLNIMQKFSQTKNKLQCDWCRVSKAGGSDFSVHMQYEHMTINRVEAVRILYRRRLFSSSWDQYEVTPGEAKRSPAFSVGSLPQSGCWFCFMNIDSLWMGIGFLVSHFLYLFVYVETFL